MAAAPTILPTPGNVGGPNSAPAPDANGPGPGGPPISPQPNMPDPNASVLGWVRDIIAATRRIAIKYPAAASDMREIQNLVQRAQQKIVQAGPSPEPMAPPV